MIKTKKHYLNNLIISLFITIALLIFSLGIGILGYHYLLFLSWVDSLLNASMILTGMGPVDKPMTDLGKVFSSFYAIYSGVAFLTSVAFLATPIFHRALHKFHLDTD